MLNKANVSSLEGATTVLIAEDEPLIGWMLEDTVSDLGMEVVGLVPTAEQGLRFLHDGVPQLCLLDVNLADGEVFPLADELRARGVPLIFHTGNSERHKLTARYPGADVVFKPSTPMALRKALTAAKERIRS